MPFERNADWVRRGKDAQLTKLDISNHGVTSLNWPQYAIIVGTMYSAKNAKTKASLIEGAKLSSCSFAGNPVDAGNHAKLTGMASPRRGRVGIVTATMTGYRPFAGKRTCNADNRAQGTPQSLAIAMLTYSLAFGTAGQNVASMEYLQTLLPSLNRNVNVYEPAVLTPNIQLLLE